MPDSEYHGQSVRAAIACSIGIMLASGTSVIGTFGMFMLPILHDFGWGRARISGVVMTMSCTTALLAPFFGRVFDRWGVRRIVVPGVIAFAGSVMLISIATNSVAAFYALFFLVGITASLISIVPYTKVVSSWFDRKRGEVLALVGVGVSIGGAILPHVARALIARWGWRGAYIGLGVLILAVNFPVQYFLLREGSPHGTHRAEDRPGVTASEARRSSTYWTLVAIIFFTTFAVGGLMPHMAPLMIGRGLSPSAAASTLSVFVLGGVTGRLAMGQLLDRFGSPRLALPFYLAAAVGMLALYRAHTPVGFALCGVAIGVCYGAEGELAPYLLSRYFGLKAFAEVYAVLFLFLAFANGLAPVVVGAVFDATRSYDRALIGLNVALVAAALLFLRLGPYRFDRPSRTAKPEPEEAVEVANQAG